MIPITPERRVDHFQRELNLPGTAGGVVDFTEPRPQYDIRGKAEVDQIEHVEELATELQGGTLAPAVP